MVVIKEADRRMKEKDKKRYEKANRIKTEKQMIQGHDFSEKIEIMNTEKYEGLESILESVAAEDFKDNLSCFCATIIEGYYRIKHHGRAIVVSELQSILLDRMIQSSSPCYLTYDNEDNDFLLKINVEKALLTQMAVRKTESGSFQYLFLVLYDEGIEIEIGGISRI